MNNPYYGFHQSGAEIKETTQTRCLTEGNSRYWMNHIEEAHEQLKTWAPELAEYVYPFVTSDRLFGAAPDLGGVKGEFFLALRDNQGRIWFEWLKD